MKRIYFGILLIIFSEITMFLRIKPFVYWFTPLVWIGYIFLVDGFVFSIKKDSLFENKKKFFLLFVISALIWWMFEYINKFVKFRGWIYINLPPNELEALTMGTLAFSTIFPAIFETKDLLSLFLSHFDLKINLKWHGLISNEFFLIFLFSLGLIFIVLPFTIKTPWLWAFVWTGFILLIDPILYLSKNKKCILSLIERRKIKTLLSIFFAGYICGFLWEFWNYWAYSKWIYTIPILEEIKIFEIPLVGFLAYGPFALEIYDFYLLVRFVEWKLEKIKFEFLA